MASGATKFAQSFGERRISRTHVKVHEGNLYSYSELFLAVANAATVDFLIRTPALESLHSVFSVGADGDTLIDFYEAPTAVTPGTLVVGFNHARFSPNTTNALFYHTSAYTLPGAALTNTKLFGGNKSGGSKPVGGTAGNDFEIVLAASTDYVIELTNVSGSAADIDFGITFYEELI